MRYAALVSGLLAACASAPAPNCRCLGSRPGMSLEEAQAIVTEFEANHLRLDPNSPLHDPHSLADVLEILKSDELDLFPAGVAFASKQEGPIAKALTAQIELAWGEAELTLAETFSLIAATRERTLRDAEPAGTATHDARARIDTDRAVAEALTRLAAEHSATGGRQAREVIQAAPADYQGYRVAADYYRMRERWNEFDATLARIAELNPDSNGLVFLRGVSALDREGDGPKADRYFRQALEKDPKFVRAQVYLLRSQRGLAAKYAEYRKLKALNPHHQLVVWTGPALERENAERSSL